MRVVILVGGGLVYEIFVKGRVHIEGCSEDLMYFFFSFLSILDTSHLVYWSCDRFDIHCTYILYILMYVFHLPLHVLFLFYLYTHVFYIMYAIYYFYFTLRCLDEFCLKCFKNIGCQSLLAINSFLVKFFKSLC